jgi:hypothetical protein
MEKLKLISKVKYIRIILRPNLVEFSCIWILYGCLDAWPIQFSFCCYFVIDHGDLHQHLDFVFYFVIDHGYLHQHLDFLFVVILSSIMIIYTSTLIFFLLLFCYRSWLFTPAPWFSFCCYFVIDHDYLHQHLDFLFVVILLSIMIIYTSTLIFFLLLFCYRSWLFTPAPWFSFCYYFVIDHGDLHQHLDFVFYFVIDHGYLHQHIDLFLLSIMIIYPQDLDFDFVFILLSIMVIYPSTLILILFLFCFRSWLFTPAPWFSFCCYFVIDHDYLHQHLDFIFYFVIGHGYLYL